MLKVNTIEFNGAKAVINSYGSDHPILMQSMTTQREQWAAKYPRATVRTEELDELTTINLVKVGELIQFEYWKGSHAVAKMSEQ